MRVEHGGQVFVWDDAKAQVNVRKHGVGFEKAMLVFDDPLAVPFPDRIVDGEERRHIIGAAGDCLLLLVVHVFREIADIEVIRIISARPPSKKERRKYELG